MQVAADTDEGGVLDAGGALAAGPDAETAGVPGPDIEAGNTGQQNWIERVAKFPVFPEERNSIR